jgi:hypothetical protein
LPDLGGDGSESFLFFLPGAREKLAAAQGEVTELRWASKDLARQLAEAACEWDGAAAWARSSAALVQSNSERHWALHNAAIATIMMVLPAGTDIPDWL